MTTVLAATAVLLAAGALATIAEAVMTGWAGLSLALSARFVFLLILIGALWPWIRRGGPRRLDPRALPGDLIDP